ncbi:NPCBM/NEW2 domain-containing protein [[Brevibacterium] frigoritolerans]|nr:NPCBM/NEW2 domain-containing protein [Peribacillus frigoritolerans]
MKIKVIGILVAFLLLASTVLPSKGVFAATQDDLLSDLEPTDTQGSYYVNDWDNDPFTAMNGKVITKGIGLDTNGRGTASATYKIDSEGYKTFRTTLSLESKWVTGDFGKTAVAFYSDDVKLYEKQLSKTDGVINVEIKLPAKTKNFVAVVKQLKGAKGTHGVILGNALFSKNGTYAPTPDLSVSPATVGANDTRGSYYESDWDDEPFRDIKNNLVTNGLGLYKSSGGTAFSTYNIDGMGLNRFETKISLDYAWTVGDFGRSSVGIYADDILLYEKEFTPKTSVQDVKLNIPKGTKNVTLKVLQIKGARGEHGVLFINPLFKKTKDRVVTAPKTIAFPTVGVIDYTGYYSENDWDNKPFQHSNNQIVTSGVALESNYDGTGSATYDIVNMGFNAIKTKVSLDSKWLNGDYGSSSVYIYAGNTLLYSAALKRTDIKNLTLRIPNKTKTVKLVVKQKRGAKGKHAVIFGNAVFTNLPITSTLKMSQISIVNNKKKDDIITVKSLSKNDTIKVYNSKGQVIASGKTTGTSISLKVKQLGTSKGKVYITRLSSGKLESDKLAKDYKAE